MKKKTSTRQSCNASPGEPRADALFLSPKQEQFCREYLVDLNSTQAANRAGYSPRTAESQGSRLLKNAKVANRIQELMDARSKKLDLSSERVLGELMKSGFADIRNMFDEQGRILPLHMMPPEVTASIASFKVVTQRVPGTDPVEVEYVSEFKLNDKTKNLELLGRHLQLFIDRIQIEEKLDLAGRMAEARKRILAKKVTDGE